MNEAQTTQRRTPVIILGAILVLLVGALVIFAYWRSSLKSSVQTQLDALKAAGLPTSGAELDVWYASVPDSENAALLLTQAFALMGTYEDARSNEVARLKLPGRGQHLSFQQAELLAGYVERNSNALAKAREAVLRPQSRYPVDLSPGFEALLPHLTKVKELARVADGEALLAIESERSADAIAAMTLILGLARSLEGEPILISQLVRIALCNMAATSLERALALKGFRDEELSRLSSAFAAAEKTNLIARALIGERASAIRCFRMSLADIERFSQAGEQGAEVSAQPPPSSEQPLIFRMTGFFERDLNFFLRAMETNIAVASLPPPRSLALTQVGDAHAAEAKRRFYVFSALLLPALSKAMLREVDGTARLRAAQVAIAAERFRLARGHQPKDLEELVPQFLTRVLIDPFNGAKLHYKQLSNGYAVYSVGRDGRDDGGQEPPAKGSSRHTAPQDITITVER